MFKATALLLDNIGLKSFGLKSTSLKNIGPIAVLILAAHVPLASGEIYRWVDKSGKVHFSDSAHRAKHEQTSQQKVDAKAVILEEINRSDSADMRNDFYAHRKEQNRHDKVMEQQRAEAKRQFQQQRNMQCQQWLAEYNSYGLRNNTLTYMADENGRSLTEKQQQNELKKMRHQLVNLGCLP